MDRLILLVESRIRGDVYVRFGGELPKTHRSNTAGRWMLSLPLGSETRYLNQPKPFRIAEMYLIAAEAENEINGPAGAYQYINAIRKRARVDQNDPTNVPDLSGLSQDQFREAVLLERQHELYEEGFAWYDLKRTQTFDKVQKARGSRLNVPIGAYNNTWLIPDTEILNNNIPQNPDYR